MGVTSFFGLKLSPFSDPVEEVENLFCGYVLNVLASKFLTEFGQHEAIVSKGAFFLNLPYGSPENNQ
jgi:hypothetical protein